MKIKSILFLFFIFYAGLLLGQQITSLQVQFGILLDQPTLAPADQNTIYEADIPDLRNWGLSLGILGELAITKKQSLIFGIETSRISYATLTDFRVGYGIEVEQGGETSTIFPAFLKNLQFDLISLPVSWRYYLFEISRIQPYLGMGVKIDMVYQEQEFWRASPYGPFVEIPLTYHQLENYHPSKNEVRHFRSQITLQFGSNFQISDRWSLGLHLQSNLLEHRPEQTSTSVDWIPAFWEQGVYFMQHTSLMMGIQRNF